MPHSRVPLGSLGLASALLLGAGGVVVVAGPGCERRAVNERHARSEAGNTQDETNEINDAPSPPERSVYDPVAYARAELGKLDNLEATIPAACYTKTEGRANPCWVCHTRPSWPNAMTDWDLQGAYDFSDRAKTNYWTNSFRDRQAAVAAIDDAEIRAWIAGDNYTPLRRALDELPASNYRGFRPDLDFAAGFDDEGFARDGSHWRAFRYKPFPGGFWPSNGSTDDVMIRLPERFRQDSEGQASRAVYKANLAILEASMASDPKHPDAALCWPTEAIDERAAGLDLDGDGELEAQVTRLSGLPEHYAGAAAEVRVRRGLYPKGTEFLHSVRYLDPEAEGARAIRMKELRYSQRFTEVSDLDIQRAYRHEDEEKLEGGIPHFGGSPLLGLRNNFGWQLQAFIEDAAGRLRVQSEEETYACMGCHSNLGVTADQSFAFPRKRPGPAGWGYQSLAGMPDAPQLGHEKGEVETYFERAHAGDEFRSNDELRERWFDAEGQPNSVAIAAAPDLAALLLPSAERALLLDKAYLVIVREQSFTRGRDGVVSPIETVFATIDEPSTGLSEAKRVYLDGSLRLAWPELDATSCAQAPS